MKDQENRFITHEAVPSPTPLEERILNNLYLSFMFSQTSHTLQHNLLSAVNEYYNPSEVKQEFPTVKRLKQRIDPQVLHLKLPSFHVSEFGGAPLRKRYVQSLFKSFSGKQTELLSSFIEDNPLYPEEKSEKKERLSSLASMIAEQDEIFIVKGRPNRGYDGDAFESFLKTYVFDKQATGSPDYDRLFKEVREVCVGVFHSNSSGNLSEQALAKKIRSLHAIWQEKHPTQTWELINQ